MAITKTPTKSAPVTAKTVTPAPAAAKASPAKAPAAKSAPAPQRRVVTPPPAPPVEETLMVEFTVDKLTNGGKVRAVSDQKNKELPFQGSIYIDQASWEQLGSPQTITVTLS